MTDCKPQKKWAAGRVWSTSTIQSVPPGPLVQVKGFRRYFSEIIKTNFAPSYSDGLIDVDQNDEFSVDDVIQLTPFELIDQAIKHELPIFLDRFCKRGSNSSESVSTAITGNEEVSSEILMKYSQALPDHSQEPQAILPSDKSATIIDEAAIPDYEQILKENHADLEALRDIERLSSKQAQHNREMNYVTPTLLRTPQPDDILVENECILSIAIFHPKKIIKMFEYMVLGRQCLTDLRDHIYCLNDHILDGNECKSGFFLIENVFYNDRRSCDSIDYSAPILEWMAARNKTINPSSNADAEDEGMFTTKEMEATTFNDLTIRVGAPYQYVHQGNCTHIIVITELRLINSNDDKCLTSYPIQIFSNKTRRRKCRICDIYPAKYVTYRDKLSHENPCFYCDQCYCRFHYNAQGKILYEDFEVYNYFHE